MNSSKHLEMMREVELEKEKAQEEAERRIADDRAARAVLSSKESDNSVLMQANHLARSKHESLRAEIEKLNIRHLSLAQSNQALRAEVPFELS